MAKNIDQVERIIRVVVGVGILSLAGGATRRVER